MEEAEVIAVKRALAYQLSELMEAQNLSKTEMARRMIGAKRLEWRLVD